MRTAIAFHAAESTAEACALLLEHDDARIVSGGTAMALLLRQGLVRPSLLVGVSRIGILRAVEENSALRLGAAVRMRVAERLPVIRERWPVLAETLQRIATPRIRNMATIGGSVAHADPSQDLPPTLVVLDARVIVVGQEGERAIRVSDFFLDYYETALRPGEIVVAVEVPALRETAGAVFLKYLPRSVDDYATVSAAAMVQLDPGALCRDVRLALGAVASTVISVDVREALVGERITPERVRAAAELVRMRIDPTEDVRGSVEYKREMAVVFARRALTIAAERSSKRAH